MPDTYFGESTFHALGWRQSLEQSLALCRQSGDMKGEARSLCFLGEMAIDLHDFEQASELLAQSASTSRGLGD
jgi:hypothetical protein